VVARLEAEERCALLKFVTSCSRAPLLGFKHLQPAFTIHKVVCDTSVWAVIGGQDVDRLPSASTCYNTLKVMSLMYFVPSNNVHAHRSLITVHLKVQDGTFRMVELWGILLCLLHHRANSPLHTSTDKILTVIAATNIQEDGDIERKTPLCYQVQHRF
jgi:hypothetical protein